MTPRGHLLLAALAVGALWAFTRTQKGQAMTADVVDAIASTVRGLRNNNPGNLEKGATWQGLAPDQTDSRFARFTEMRYGVRAAARVFRNYQKLYSLRTITQMVARWAPTSENDTASYVAAVAKRVGVDAAAPLDLMNAETCYRFLRAIFRHECGIAAEAIPESTIREGISLA